MIYGWLNGDGVTMQYVQNKERLEVTTDITQAACFASLIDCQNNWRCGHAIPSDFEHCLHDGYIKYFDNNGQMLMI